MVYCFYGDLMGNRGAMRESLEVHMIRRMRGVLWGSFGDCRTREMRGGFIAGGPLSLLDDGPLKRHPFKSEAAVQWVLWGFLKCCSICHLGTRIN